MPLDARAVAYEIVRTIRTVLGGGGLDAVRTAFLSIEDQARGDRDAIRADLLGGYLTPEGAKLQYGGGGDD